MPQLGTLLTNLVTIVTSFFTSLTTGLSSLTTALNFTALTTSLTSLVTTVLNLTATVVAAAVNLTVLVLQVKIAILTAIVNATASLLGDDVLNERIRIVNLLFNTTMNITDLNSTTVSVVLDSNVTNVSALVIDARSKFVAVVLNSSMPAATSIVAATTTTLTQLAENVASSGSQLLNSITLAANVISEGLLSKTTPLSKSASNIEKTLNTLGNAIASTNADVQASLNIILESTIDVNADVSTVYNDLALKINADIKAAVAANSTVTPLIARLSPKTIQLVITLIEHAISFINSVSGQYAEAAVDLSNPFKNFENQLNFIVDEAELQNRSEYIKFQMINIQNSQNALINTVLVSLKKTVNKTQNMLVKSVTTTNTQNVNTINKILEAATAALKDKMVGPCMRSLTGSMKTQLQKLEILFNGLGANTTAAIDIIASSIPGITANAKVAISASTDDVVGNLTASLKVGNNVDNYLSTCLTNGLYTLNANTNSVFNDINYCIQLATDASLNPFLDNGNVISAAMNGASNAVGELINCLRVPSKPKPLADCLQLVQNSIDKVSADAVAGVKNLLKNLGNATAQIIPDVTNCVKGAVATLSAGNLQVPTDLISCLS